MKYYAYICFMAAHEPGRPPVFENAQELQDKIDEYFKTGVKVRSVTVGKPPKVDIVEIPVPTISGLCLYLGFSSRQSFYDYEKRDGFSYTVKRARLFIEVEYEEQLQHGNTTGAIFALKNMGWKDAQAIDHTVKELPEIHFVRASKEKS